MLVPAAAMIDEYKRVYFESTFDPKYKFIHIGGARLYQEPKASTDEESHFVSVFDGRIVGEVKYSFDFQTRRASLTRAARYGKSGSVTFMRDLAAAIDRIFRYHNLNKLEYHVVVGNPAEHIWDRLTEKHGGRIVGIWREAVMLEDGKLYDYKAYELMASEYLVKR